MFFNIFSFYPKLKEEEDEQENEDVFMSFLFFCKTILQDA